MTHQNPFQNPLQNPFTEFFKQNDMRKVFEQFQSFPMDVKEILEMYRRNFQALADANQLTIENAQAIVQRQGQILSQMAEDHSRLTRQMMEEGTPEEKIARHAQLFKETYQRTAESLQEVSDLLNKTRQEAGTLINKRVAASMNEIEQSLEKARDKAA